MTCRAVLPGAALLAAPALAQSRPIGIAAGTGVPVAGVREAEPDGEGHAHWMLSQLDAADAALARGPAS
jgi:hypothetical protein